MSRNRTPAPEEQAAKLAGYGRLTCYYNNGEDDLLKKACAQLDADGIEYKIVKGKPRCGVAVWRKNLRELPRH